MTSKLIIIGAGGLGPEVLWAATRGGALQPAWDVVGFCDDDPAKKAQSLGGVPVLGRIEDATIAGGGAVHFVCAVGSNARRRELVARALAAGWQPGTVIDPTVQLGPGASVGSGSYVGCGSIVSVSGRVGEHVIINHHCTIGHDSEMGDFSQASPGTRVSGGCRVGAGALLGSNAVLAPGVSLGDNAVLGAASFALRNVPAGATAVGNPARVLMTARA